jgi:quercetin dioxygenase-like cupin family protein
MAEKKKRAMKLRPVEAQVQQFAVLGEMTSLLQRVRANKSKRTAAILSKAGPFRITVVALDTGGQLQDHAVDGPFTVQCLLGRVALSIVGREHWLTTGDVLVAEAAMPHDISAEEASVLLVTVAAAGALKE